MKVLKHMRYFLIFTTIVTLSACQATVDGDEASIKTDSYGIEIGNDDYDSKDGKFCPPGQAKKGRC